MNARTATIAQIKELEQLRTKTRMSMEEQDRADFEYALGYLVSSNTDLILEYNLKKQALDDIKLKMFSELRPEHSSNASTDNAIELELREQIKKEKLEKIYCEKVDKLIASFTRWAVVLKNKNYTQQVNKDRVI